jgi:thioredoxin reductase (NADPH)
MTDILVIGGGPAGLAVAREAGVKGFNTQIVEQDSIAGSLCRYPVSMQFVSPAEDLMVGGIPFISAGLHPVRNEAIRYYQKVARSIGAELRLGLRVFEIHGADNAFLVKCQDREGDEVQLRCKKVVVATGSFAAPRLLHIPGEDGRKVSHHYSEPFSCEGLDVLVVGGGDSAAEAALELAANNAAVTLSYRRREFTRLRPWTHAALEQAIREKRLKFHGGSLVREIRSRDVLLWIKEQGEQSLPNDFVYLLTGYLPDYELLGRTGVTLGDGEGAPAYFNESFESNIAGLYLAGALLGSQDPENVVIASFRRHAAAIVRDILSKM